MGNDASTIIDHIEALEGYSKHKIWVLSNVGDMSYKLDLDKFDVIIIHYSMCILNDNYLSATAKKRIKDYKGMKLIFVQDEYRKINLMINQLQRLDVDVLFTCFPEEEIDKIYSPVALPDVAKYNNLTGYIPERLLTDIKQPLIKDRAIHLGYRGRKLSYWYGELGYEKWSIVDKWKEHVKQEAIKYDLSYHERDRIYGKNWVAFLTSCKATLGVESGASIMDFTGDLEQDIEYYQMLHPHAKFHEVKELFLKEHDGKYKLNQISPRCFEAIALKTALVLYEGEYSGILVADRHYIMLKKDFSNIEDVVARLTDDDYLQAMVERAYDEIALNQAYSYRTFVNHVDQVIDLEFAKRHKKKRKKSQIYTQERFEKDCHYISIKSRLFKISLAAYQRLPVPMRLVVKGLIKPKLTVKFIIRNFYKLTSKGS